VIRRRTVVAFALVLAFSSACGGGGGGNDVTSPTNGGGNNSGGSNDPTPSANQIVAGSNSTFNPTTLTVTKGTTVTFTFLALTHNVTFDAGTGAPSNIGNSANTSATRTFSTSGSFGFQCTLHSGMTGKVVVN